MLNLQKFGKMQALGNDFVMIDGISSPPASDLYQKVTALADRHRGIGFDQMLVALPPRSDKADVFCKIFNADGSESGQCGNGMRCFASFLHQNHLAQKDHGIRIETCTGIYSANLLPNEQVSVDMGRPRFANQDIPFIAESDDSERYMLELSDRQLEIGAVSMGNPHAVTLVSDLDQAPVALVGNEVSMHPRFPERANVEFVSIDNTDVIRIRIFERGAGETLACGSGACAAAAVTQAWGLVGSEVRVLMPGGAVSVRRDSETEHLWLTGEAKMVYRGEINLNHV